MTYQPPPEYLALRKAECQCGEQIIHAPIAGMYWHERTGAWRCDGGDWNPTDSARDIAAFVKRSKVNYFDDRGKLRQGETTTTHLQDGRIAVRGPISGTVQSVGGGYVWTE